MTERFENPVVVIPLELANRLLDVCDDARETYGVRMVVVQDDEEAYEKAERKYDFIEDARIRLKLAKREVLDGDVLHDLLHFEEVQ